MMSAIESTSALNVRHPPVALKLSAYAAMVVARLRAIAPYALMELILPGGSVMALLLWLYRRQRRGTVFATAEIRYAGGSCTLYRCRDFAGCGSPFSSGRARSCNQKR